MTAQATTATTLVRTPSRHDPGTRHRFCLSWANAEATALRLARFGNGWRRVRNAGPRALGRPAAAVDEWKLIRAVVLARAGYRCQACGRRTRLEVHHVIKRSQGGSDFDLDRLIALCRRCHERTDAPYRQGRLVITPLGVGRFICEIVWRTSKWQAEGEIRNLCPRWANDAPHAERHGQPRHDIGGRTAQASPSMILDPVCHSSLRERNRREARAGQGSA
jgi:HNH endonuclease